MYKFIFHNYSCRFPLCSAPALELESDTGNGLCSPVYTDSLIPLVYFMLSPSSSFSLGYCAQCLHLRRLEAACAWSRYRHPPLWRTPALGQRVSEMQVRRPKVLLVDFSLLIKCLILGAVPVWLLWTVQTFSSELSVRINLNNQKAEACVALKLPREIWYSKRQMKEQGTTFAEMGRAARLPPKACIEIQGQTSCFLAKGARTPERNKHQFRDPLVPGLSQMLIGYVTWTRGLIPLDPSCSFMKRV